MKLDYGTLAWTPLPADAVDRLSAGHTPRIRVQVRRHTYRGRDGFLVSYCDKSGRSFFSDDEQEARRMANEARQGLSPRFDFQINRELIGG